MSALPELSSVEVPPTPNPGPEHQAPADRHRELVRESLAKVDGGLLALADACRSTFGHAGLKVWRGEGAARERLNATGEWESWPEGQR